MPDRHTWIIDEIAEDTARVEEDGERVLHVPRSILPADAREGLVLSVTRTPDGRGGLTLTIAIDHAATATATEQSRKQVAKIGAASAKRDRGGDVEL